MHFGRISEARSFIATHRASFARVKAKADALGAGRGAYVRISKNRDVYNQRIRAYAMDKTEVTVLRSLLGGNYYSQVAGSGGGGGAAAGGSGASSAARPLSVVSRNVGVPRAAAAAAAAADARKGSVGRRPEVEVIDLCSSP